MRFSGPGKDDSFWEASFSGSNVKLTAFHPRAAAKYLMRVNIEIGEMEGDATCFSIGVVQLLPSMQHQIQLPVVS